MAEEENKTTSTRGRKPKTEEVKVDDKMDEMFKQMQEQIAMLQAQLNEKNSTKETETTNTAKELYKSIKVISLVPYTVVVATEGNSRSATNRRYVFDKYGQSFAIPVTELQKIMTTCQSLFIQGLLVMASKEDYELMMMEHIYSEVMTKKEIDNLIKLSSDDDVEIILQMDGEIKEAIGYSIAEKINKGHSYDYNKIQKLKNGGFNIDEFVEATKKVEE